MTTSALNIEDIADAVAAAFPDLRYHTITIQTDALTTYQLLAILIESAGQPRNAALLFPTNNIHEVVDDMADQPTALQPSFENPIGDGWSASEHALLDHIKTLIAEAESAPAQNPPAEPANLSGMSRMPALTPAFMPASCQPKRWPNAGVDAGTMPALTPAIDRSGRHENRRKQTLGHLVRTAENGPQKPSHSRKESKMPQQPRADPRRSQKAREVAALLADTLSDAGIEITWPRFQQLEQLVADMLPPAEPTMVILSQPERRLAA